MYTHTATVFSTHGNPLSRLQRGQAIEQSVQTPISELTHFRVRVLHLCHKFPIVFLKLFYSLSIAQPRHFGYIVDGIAVLT